MAGLSITSQLLKRQEKTKLGREKEKVDSPEAVKRYDGYKIAAREATSSAAIAAAREVHYHWHRKPNMEHNQSTWKFEHKMSRIFENWNTWNKPKH